MIKHNNNNLKQLEIYTRMKETYIHLKAELENLPQNTAAHTQLYNEIRDLEKDLYEILSKNHLNPRFRQHPTRDKMNKNVATQRPLSDFWRPREVTAANHQQVLQPIY